MPLELRSYQEHGVIRVRSMLAARRRDLCIELPTGGGKTVCLAKFLMDPVKQVVYTHRRILLDQTAAVLKKYGVDFGYRASGRPTNFDAPIQLAMLRTEYTRTVKTDKWPVHQAERIHIDEVHTVQGAQNLALFNRDRELGASVIGYTATPSDIGNVCDEKFVMATVCELIDAGYLAQPLVFGPSVPDMNRVAKLKRQANGDFERKGVNEVYRKEMIFGNVVDNLKALNPTGVPAILFASGVKESIWFAQMLSNIGIPAAHVDGNTVWVDGKQYNSDTDVRAEIFERVACGDIKVVCNRFVLREGFDCPAIGHCIITCPVGKRSTYVQMVGRVLRPYEGKENAIIQDHGGNWLMHPPIDSDEPWEIGFPERIIAQARNEEIREHKIPEPIVCPKCNAVRVSGRTCLVCSYEAPKYGRYVMQVDGTLRYVQGPAFAPRKITRTPVDHKTWSRLYWGNKKNHPERSFQQIYTYHALKNNWKWLPRDLPLMPQSERQWFLPVGDVSTDSLR